MTTRSSQSTTRCGRCGSRSIGVKLGTQQSHRSGSSVTRAAELADAGAEPTVLATGPPVLQSKLAVPEPPRFMVTRSRFLHRLTESTPTPVTVVTGPAGGGKTEAVASWVRAGAGGQPVAWVT